MSKKAFAGVLLLFAAALLVMGLPDLFGASASEEAHPVFDGALQVGLGVLMLIGAGVFFRASRQPS